VSVVDGYFTYNPVESITFLPTLLRIKNGPLVTGVFSGSLQFTTATGFHFNFRNGGEETLYLFVASCSLGNRVTFQKSAIGPGNTCSVTGGGGGMPKNYVVSTSTDPDAEFPAVSCDFDTTTVVIPAPRATNPAGSGGLFASVASTNDSRPQRSILPTGYWDLYYKNLNLPRKEWNF